MRLTLALARRVPRRLGYPIAEAIGRLVGRFASQWRAILESNLAPVLEDADHRRIRRVAIEIFACFVRAYYEVLYLPYVSDEQIAAMMSFDGPGWPAFQQAYRQGQGTILISTHQSSFDLAGQALAVCGFPTHVLALPEQAASLGFMQKLREQRGIRVLPLSPRAIREAFRALRNGGIVVLAADRTLQGQGVEVEFFGRPTVLPDGHVRLALRTGAPMFAAFCFRENGEYHFRFFQIDLARSGNEEVDIRDNVQRIARMIEDPIRAHPEQWHLFRRLWP